MIEKGFSRPGGLVLVLVLALLMSFSFGVGSAGAETKEKVETESSGGLEDLWGGGTETTVTSGQDTPDINSLQNQAYDGPKARVAVSRFEDKTGGGWYSWQIGDGMADQMATALVNSNYYIVLERQQLGDVLAEQDLGDSGRVKTETAAPIGEIEGAELLITGSVTEFRGDAGGTQGSLGGLLGDTFGGIVGAVTGGFQEAHVAIDVRVIDTKTSRIVAATSVEGDATDVNLGGALAGYGGGALGGSLSAWSNTPIEKALRICIQRAVDFIVSKTPEVYYRNAPAAVAQTVSTAPSQTAITTQVATPPASFTPGTVVRVKPAKLNMRGGPGTSNAVVASLGQNELLLVQSQNGDWVQVQDARNSSGWVASWLIYSDGGVTLDDFDDAVEQASTGGAATQSSVSTTGAVTTESTGGESTGGDAASSGSSKADIKAKLQQLKELYDAELITQEEYDAKRAEIISNL
ncbi:MAG: CsgG/HfaB family protein [Pseudomonadota bacterium]